MKTVKSVTDAIQPYIAKSRKGGGYLIAHCGQNLTPGRWGATLIHPSTGKELRFEGGR